MPRTPRLDEPGSRHHVMNRGARRQVLFHSDQACIVFLELLAELPRRYGVHIHGYALMPNHFHLMVESGATGLAPAMQYLQAQYSRALNRSAGWDGPVWRARYRSQAVESEPYWIHLLAYLHLNPVEAGLVPHEDLALWTSHKAYTGQSPRPDWLQTAQLLELYGSVEAYRDYLREVRLGREKGPDGFDPEGLGQSRIAAPPPAVEQDAPRPRKVAWPLGEEEAWAALTLVTGLPREEIEARGRGRARNPAWWLALWWLPQATGQAQSAVGRSLNVQASSISRSRAYLLATAEQDPTVARWLDRLVALLP